MITVTPEDDGLPVHISHDKDWVYLESGDETLMFKWSLLPELIEGLLFVKAQMKGKGT